MKKFFILASAVVLFFSILNYQSAKASFETDFSAFMIGDSDNTVATFTYLGEKKTLSVAELKEQLKTLGFGQFFANDERNSGYTANVERAFKSYAESYEQRLNAAEKGFSMSSITSK